MKRLSKFFALFLALVLFTTGCGSNMDSYATTVAATYGDKTVYLDEANFWLRYEQTSYSYLVYLYQQYYQVSLSDFWNMKSNRRTQTYEDSVKEDVMAAFRQMFILLDHSADYDTTLTQDEYAKIDDSIREMKKNYETTLFRESAIGPFTDEKLRDSIIRFAQALKVWNGVREEATVSVTDEEARSFTVNYFQINASSSATPEGESAALSGENLAEFLTTLLANGTDFDKVKSQFSSLTSGTTSYRWNDSTNETVPQSRLGRVLSDGQVTWQKDGNSWYVVQMVSANDADASAKARADLESAQKEAHFNEVYTEWQKAAKPFSVKSSFKNLKMVIDQ